MDTFKGVRTHGIQHPWLLLKTKEVKMEQKDYPTTTFSQAMGSHAAGPLGPHVLPRVHVLMDSQALAPASFVGTFSGSRVHLPAQHRPSGSEW